MPSKLFRIILYKTQFNSKIILNLRIQRPLSLKNNKLLNLNLNQNQHKMLQNLNRLKPKLRLKLRRKK